MKTSERRWSVAWIAVLFAVGGVLAGPGRGEERRVSAKLKAEANGRGQDRVDVILQFDAEHGPPRLDAEIGARVHRRFENLPMMTLSLPAHRVERLARGNGVRFVSLDDAVFATSGAGRNAANTPRIGSYYDNVYNGNGLSVAVIDSGVAPHVDLWIRHQQDFVDGKSHFPNDPYGHGTHVAGIVAGSGAGSGFVHWGQAWNAGIVSLRVLDANGDGNVSNILAAVDWLLSHGATHDVRVVNLSVGKSIEERAADDPLVQAVEQLWDAGFTVVCSAGNFGKSGHGSITSPGNSPKVITVGSWTDNGTKSFNDDFVSTYSSRGPTLYDQFVKPDLVAPGNRVVSTMGSDATMLSSLPDRVADCGRYACYQPYFELSGTSMAAPMVAGAAIRMIGRDPSLTPATVKARLMASARDLPDHDALTVGAGLLDVRAALDATGHATVAPSPRIGLLEGGSKVVVEDVASTWGAPWDAAVLWTDAVLWENAVMWSDAVLWDDAVLWGDAVLWDDAILWSDAVLWDNAIMWSDAILWDDAVLWADVVPTSNPGVLSGTVESMSCIDDPGSSAPDEPADSR